MKNKKESLWSKDVETLRQENELLRKKIDREERELMWKVATLPVIWAIVCFVMVFYYIGFETGFDRLYYAEVWRCLGMFSAIILMVNMLRHGALNH